MYYREKFWQEVEAFYEEFYKKNFALKKRLCILWECDFPEEKLKELENFFRQFPESAKYKQEREAEQ